MTGIRVGFTSAEMVQATITLIALLSICALVIAVSLGRWLGVRYRVANTGAKVSGELVAHARLPLIIAVVAAAGAVVALWLASGDPMITAVGVFAALCAVIATMWFLFAANDVVAELYSRGANGPHHAPH